MLGDDHIRRALRSGLRIDGWDERRLQSASYDVCLDHQLLVLDQDDDGFLGALDPKLDCADDFTPVEIDPEHGYVLAAGTLALGSTIERVRLPDHLAGQLQGKSSLGRLGLMVHSTAGHLDPGFHGHITLELAVVHRRGVRLYPGMPIGQIAFHHVNHVTRSYSGKYNGQSGPTPSRYHLNWTGEGWR